MGSRSGSVALQDIDKVLSTIRQQYSSIDSLFPKFDARFSAIEARFFATEARLSAVESTSTNDRLSALEAMVFKLTQCQSISTSPQITPPQEAKEVHNSTLVGSEHQESLIEKLVWNNTSARTKSSTRKRKGNNDDTFTVKKSEITKKSKTTKETKSAVDEFGKSAGAEVSGPPESIQRSNEEEKKVHNTPLVGPKHQESLKDKLVLNYNSSLAKSATRKRKANYDDTSTAKKSDITKKNKTTKETKSVGDKFGKDIGAKVSGPSESLQRSNEAKTREGEKQPITIESAENLVGLKVNVYWPDDGVYYSGVIDSYDPATKMHKVIYDDGDTEMLVLEKEQWNLIEGPPLLHITVKGLEGFLVPLEVKSSNTISDVKVMIHSKQGMLPHLQILVLKTEFGYLHLDDEKTVADYRLDSESGVFLLDVIDKIYVDNLTETFILDAKRSDRIDDIKLKIYEMTGMLPDEQQLFFNGHQLGLGVGETLGNYMCFNECTIFLGRRR